MLQNQTRVAPARMNVAEAMRRFFRGARIPLFRLGQIATDQSCFAQGRQFPVLIPAGVLNFFQTLRANHLRDLTGAFFFADEQIHGRGIDSRPVTAA